MVFIFFILLFELFGFGFVYIEISLTTMYYFHGWKQELPFKCIQNEMVYKKNSLFHLLLKINIQCLFSKNKRIEFSNLE